MIKQSDGKVGSREFAALIIITTGLKYSDQTPTILFNLGENAAWMVVIVSFITMLIPFFILVPLFKKYKLGLIQLIYLLFGKYIGFGVGLILFISFFAASIYGTRSYVDIISPLFFSQTPISILYLLGIIGIYFIANRGLEAIGRTAWIVLPYVSIAIVFLLFWSIKELDIPNIFPLFGSGIGTIVKDGIKYSSILGELIILSVIYPYVRSHKDYKISSLLGISISVFQLVLFLVIFVMVFDYPSVRLLAFPYQHLTRFIRISHFLSHTEAIFLGFWVMASIVHFAVYLYVSAAILAYTLKMDEIEPLLLPLAWLTLLIGLIPENMYQNVYLTRELFLRIDTYLLIFLPLLLWLTDKWKGRRAQQ